MRKRHAIDGGHDQNTVYDIGQEVSSRKKPRLNGVLNGTSRLATATAVSAAADVVDPEPLLNFSNGSRLPEQEFQLTHDCVEGEILCDIDQKQWRIGKPIGKGSFGEIFLASDDVMRPVLLETAEYVVKIEPHSNGPLFVEIHCLLNTGRPEPLPPGMPAYIASGSHVFDSTRYRFLILRRYRRDLHSIMKDKYPLATRHVATIALQILDVLEHLHNCGYAHSDIKAENLMIGSADTPLAPSSAGKNKSPTATPATPVSYRTRCRSKRPTEFSGTNPVRSCRMATAPNATPDNVHNYQDMLKCHYLRPQKLINYQQDSSDTASEPAYTITPKRLSKSLQHPLVKEQYRIYLIDFGIASKFIDSQGVHHPFCMDQRRAHDGTLEFTSRDAHMGAHSRRSDLECLGYNLIYWSMGHLPWRPVVELNQPEDVHRMKEYFMTDVKHMLQLVYGAQVPSFLGKYMSYVSKLGYTQRPDYDRCRRIIRTELARQGLSGNDQQLDYVDLIRSVSLRKTAAVQSLVTPANGDAAKNIRSIKSIMKFSLMMPFRESMPATGDDNVTGQSQLSPKNLRSKTDRLSRDASAVIGRRRRSQQQSKRKRFSWVDVLSVDPDQIARDRAEREFEAEEELGETPARRYSGKPTYAIREIEEKMRARDADMANGCGSSNGAPSFETDQDDTIKGYTKPMMDILRKRQVILMAQFERQRQSYDVGSLATHRASGGGGGRVEVDGSSRKQHQQRTSRKSGLRKCPRQTTKSIDYRTNVIMMIKRRSPKRSSSEPETMCSSSSPLTAISPDRELNNLLEMSSDEEDSRDTLEYSPVKTRHKRKVTVGKTTVKRKSKRVGLKKNKDDQTQNVRTFFRG